MSKGHELAAIGRRDDDWGIELTGFGRPFGLGFDADRRLHVTDMDLHLLVRFDVRLESFEWHDGSADGWSGAVPLAATPTDPAPPRPPSGWNGPHSVEFDRVGRLYVTCYYGAAIHVLSASGMPSSILGQGLLRGPASAFFDDADRLLVAEYADNAVLVLDTGGTLIGRMHADFDRPHMARALPDGTVAVADTWNNRVRRFTAGGDPIGSASTPAIACPVAIDPAIDGRLLVTAWGADAVISLDSNGQETGRLAAPALRQPVRCPLHQSRGSRGSRVVVADSHHSRVLILASPELTGA